jgi:CHAT domain-containing protein/tetratricopeptide (TPR) repeat protein
VSAKLIAAFRGRRNLRIGKRMIRNQIDAACEEIDRLCDAGEIDEAIERCRHAMERAENADSRWYLAFWTGSHCINGRRLEDAVRLLEYAAAAKPTDLDAGRAMRVHINLAIALCSRSTNKDVVRAATVLQQGIRLAQSQAHPAERVELHGHLGNVMSMLGAHGSAESYHREAVALAREAVDPGAIALWTGNLAMSRLAADDAETAITLFTEALESAPEPARAENGGRWEDGLRAARALAEKRSMRRTPTFDRTPSAYVFGLAPCVSMIPSVKEKKALIASERAKIDAAIKETIADREPFEAFALIDCVKSLVGRELMYRKRLEMSIIGTAAPQHETAVLHGLRLEQVAEYLARDTSQCIVSFYYTDEHDYYAFVGTAANGVPHVERIKIASGYAGYRLSQHLNALSERRRADSSADSEKMVMKVISEVSQAILPRLKRVPGIRRVLLCPYKLLHCVPLHAMMAEEDGSAIILEEFACVSYAGSFMSHLAARTSLPKRKPKQDCIVFAYVEQPDDKSIDPLEADAYHVAFDNVGWLHTTRDPDAIPADLGDVPFICWSSHAASDPTSWDSSYLSAGAKTISGSFIVDQWLLRETHCAVLSGCETAYDNSVGDAVDEYFGLDQAVHIAGAASVIGTIYPVDDDYAGIMTLLLLEGMLKQRLSPSEALRQARVELSSGEWRRNLSAAYKRIRAEKGGRLDSPTRRFFDRAMAIDESDFASPTFWATYRCLGNW